MKVLRNAQNDRFIPRNALGLVAPFSGNLDCSLNSFGASVHWQHHVEVEKLSNKLGKAREDIIVECS